MLYCPLMICHYSKYGLLWGLLLVAGSGAFAQTAPTLSVVPQDSPARPGEPFAVTLEVAWSGSGDAWGVLPAEIGDVAWGTVTRGEAHLSKRDNQFVYAQTVLFTARESGDYETPELLVPYETPDVLARSFSEAQMPGEDNPGPLLRQLSGGTVQVVVRKPFPFVLVGTIVALTLILVLAGLGTRRWRARNEAAQRLARLAPVDRAQTLLHDARRSRLDGEFYNFYQQLTAAVSVAQAHPPARELASRLQERTREVGYKGVRPTEDELDGDAKAAEAVVDQWKKEMPG